jgi:hypothetical protein
MIQVL